MGTVVGLVTTVGMLIIVVGLLVIGVEIDTIGVGLLIAGVDTDTAIVVDLLIIEGITTGTVAAGVDTTGDIVGAISGSTIGMEVAKPLDPDPWIGNAPAELTGAWAKAVPTKVPRDAERRYSSFVMLRTLSVVRL